jgi:hypothetical protein
VNFSLHDSALDTANPFRGAAVGGELLFAEFTLFLFDVLGHIYSKRKYRSVGGSLLENTFRG